MAIYRERGKINRKWPKCEIKLNPINIQHKRNKNPSIKKDFTVMMAFLGTCWDFCRKNLSNEEHTGCFRLVGLSVPLGGSPMKRVLFWFLCIVNYALTLPGNMNDLEKNLISPEKPREDFKKFEFGVNSDNWIKLDLKLEKKRNNKQSSFTWKSVYAQLNRSFSHLQLHHVAFPTNACSLNVREKKRTVLCVHSNGIYAILWLHGKGLSVVGWNWVAGAAAGPLMQL